MLRKLMVVAALALLPAAAAQAQFQAGDWALTLSGQGSHGPDLDGTSFGLNADIGYRYGDVHNTFVAGPEGGVKYFVNSTTFVQFNVNYQFFFDNNTDSAGDAFSDGQFLYSLGIGFRWH